MASEAFLESLAKLGDSEEDVLVAKALFDRATNYPEKAPPLRRTAIRVVKTNSTGGYPPLRLFYALDDDVVYLLFIERYDELLGADEL